LQANHAAGSTLAPQPGSRNTQHNTLTHTRTHTSMHNSNTRMGSGANQALAGSVLGVCLHANHAAASCVSSFWRHSQTEGRNTQQHTHTDNQACNNSNTHAPTRNCAAAARAAQHWMVGVRPLPERLNTWDCAASTRKAQHWMVGVRPLLERLNTWDCAHTNSVHSTHMNTYTTTICTHTHTHAAVQQSYCAFGTGSRPGCRATYT
jgi:hypothetical protein